MIRKAKIYYKDHLAGSLTEGDSGYSFIYTIDYLQQTHQFNFAII